MPTHSSLLCGLYLVVCVFGKVGVKRGAEGEEEEEWCYEEANCKPTKWGGLCNTGDKQSPVGFKISKDMKPNRSCTLRLEGMKVDHFYLHNDGAGLFLHFVPTSEY